MFATANRPVADLMFDSMLDGSSQKAGWDACNVVSKALGAEAG
jgi:hypothetical protein